MSTPLYRSHEDQNWWNFFFSLFFLVVLSVSVWEVYRMRGGFPSSVSVLDVVLMALASMRITRLVVYDKITRFFRDWFVNTRVIEVDGVLLVEVTPTPHGFRGTMNDLLGCPWCVGMWSGLIVTFCYFVFPWAWYVILFLAVAGMGSLLQVFANTLGWRAENLKLDAQSKEQ